RILGGGGESGGATAGSADRAPAMGAPPPVRVQVSMNARDGPAVGRHPKVRQQVESWATAPRHEGAATTAISRSTSASWPVSGSGTTERLSRPSRSWEDGEGTAW